MKKFIAALTCVALVGTAQAFDPRILVPNPLSIALTVGQWMMKDRVETYYLRVQAAGRTEEDARTQAFKLAVDQAVGSLLLSEAKVVNGDVARHEIINYSSGYIHDFKILKRYNDGRDTVIEIDVWVRKSQIADRLLNKSAGAGTVEGGRISQQIQSIQRERATGDRVLSTVLADFPERAFDVALHPTQVRLDQNRQGQLQVSFNLSWNRQYIASLAEAVKVINQRRDCGGWLSNCRYTSMVGVGSVESYFDDEVAQDLLHRELIISRPSVLLTIKDTMGSMRYRKCHSFPALDHTGYSTWNYANIGPGWFRVHPGAARTFDIFIGLGNLPTGQLDRAEITIVRAQQC